ncbi:transporter [Acidisphaera sp. S103]|uniref:SphA family protein n=1 Tax=Acidisphaera sp. S103 TaxID=1747223 RepID=UPI001C209A25|nr:transporter [Acidisphaera sp. S103]
MLAVAAALICPAPSSADEGGISFWLPGLNGSLAAVPGVPGPSFTALYYYTSLSAGGGKTFELGGKIVGGLGGQANLAAFGPTYTFATPVIGAQLSVSLLGIAGASTASVDATLTGPFGRSISGSRSDEIGGFGDLIPQAALKWNKGVNNFMTYVTGDIPAGNYSSNRLANLGIGHAAIDGGGGYTYLNPATGREFSAALGLTYNFENMTTHYQNGVDLHLDWGASQFLSKQFLVGIVGYVYAQISPDGGAGATLGSFESRVLGIGPQIGYMFPIGSAAQGYINLKGYKEFAAQNRPDGWNLWLTMVITPAPPHHENAQALLFPTGQR